MVNNGEGVSQQHSYLTAFTSSVRIHGQLVRLYARGIEDSAAVNYSEENDRTLCTNTLS